MLFRTTYCPQKMSPCCCTFVKDIMKGHTLGHTWSINLIYAYNVHLKGLLIHTINIAFQCLLLPTSRELLCHPLMKAVGQTAKKKTIIKLNKLKRRCHRVLLCLTQLLCLHPSQKMMIHSIILSIARGIFSWAQKFYIMWLTNCNRYFLLGFTFTQWSGSTHRSRLIQTCSQTFLEGGSKSGKVTQMKWAF